MKFICWNVNIGNILFHTAVGISEMSHFHSDGQKNINIY